LGDAAVVHAFLARAGDFLDGFARAGARFGDAFARGILAVGDRGGDDARDRGDDGDRDRARGRGRGIGSCPPAARCGVSAVLDGLPITFCDKILFNRGDLPPRLPTDRT
jgi:hypothetical protein